MSDSETSSESEVETVGYVSDNQAGLEVEGDMIPSASGGPSTPSETDSDSMFCDHEYIAAYADEPLADEAWLEQYNMEKEEENRLREQLQERLNLPASLW